MFPEYWFICRDITHILLHTDGACKSKYTTVLTTYISAWVERCSSKLNNLSMVLLEKNLAGGNPHPRFFSSHPSIN